MTVISYRQALHDTLRAELQRDDNVFLLGEEIGRASCRERVLLGV